jgi:hypothetical protein
MKVERGGGSEKGANRIKDVRPFSGLALDEFATDEVLSVPARGTRTFPVC